MAKIFYLLKQNKNEDAKIYGKWFAHAKSVETLNTRKPHRALARSFFSGRRRPAWYRKAVPRHPC